MADPVPVPAPVPDPSPKPGYKTTEFWLTVAVQVIAVLMLSGVIAPGSFVDKAVGIASAALAAMGYTASRAMVKSS